MNYLLSAYSVNPYNGSEDGIGWNWVVQLDRHYKPGDRIILLTKRFNEKDTRRGLKEFNIKHVELAITDVPMCLNWFREKHSTFHHMYYILWQHWAWLWVKKSGIKFDVIHHVTMNDYRIPSKMYKAKNSKVIWGPVGGAQVTPKALMCYEKSRLTSKFRELINKSCSWNPFYKNAIKKYDKIYCINKETKQQIEQILDKEIELLPELALRDEYKNLPIIQRHNKVVTVVFVGRLIGKKGIAFLIDALALMPKDFDWKLQIFGDGNDRKTIENQIRQSRIASKVTLMGNRTMSQISEAFMNADIFVLPSLRETSGNVLVEAMSHAVPIVGFDTSFCSQLKDLDCGIFINTEQPLNNIKEDFCNAVMKLGQDSQLRYEKGINGYNWVNTELTWEKKYDRIYNEDLKKI